jgi:signal transduction histidine kinase
MKATDYLRDKVSLILLNITCALLLFIYLSAVGVGRNEIMLVFIAWIFVLLGYMSIQFLIMRKRIENINATMDSLDKKYLFAEIVENNGNAEQQAFFLIIQSAMRSMIEEVSISKKEKEDYQEYIEQLAHEIKVPLTSIILNCENNLDDNARKILLQTKHIEDYLEQVLYYARLGNVENDYMIKEVCLDEFVNDALLRNKQALIQNHIAVEANNLDYSVYTDSKWLIFIINQIINNSVRYKKENPVLEINGSEKDGVVQLEIKDNGIGVRESEIGRVFQKGFTGSNGRSRKGSTGMGLYICKGLCDKLGIEIEIDSELDQYTSVKIIFPKSGHYIKGSPNITKL